MMVAGGVSPLIPNAEPVTVMAEIVRALFPLFVSWMLCVLFCPTVTFPKFTGDGVMDKVGVPVPVPVKATDRGEFAASLTTDTVPAAALADCGAN